MNLEGWRLDFNRSLPLGDEYRLLYAWAQMRVAYEASPHEAIMLNQGGPAEQPFSVDFAIEWAERLAEYAL